MNIQDLHRFFKEKGLTLGSVESFTGGSFASQVTSISGASKFYAGGLVTYFTEEKIRLLSIDKNLVEKYGVVSSEIAFEMANKGRETLDVDYCISFTGNAGPSAMENKPVGLVYIGVSSKQTTQVLELQLNGNRHEVISNGIQEGIKFLLNVVK